MTNSAPISPQSGSIAVDRRPSGSREMDSRPECCVQPPAHVSYRPVGLGVLGSIGMVALYLAIVSVAESPAHAIDLFREDAWLVLPLIIGFGIQVGLFTYMQLGLHVPHGFRSGAITGATGGTSTLAMAACCAHHATDVLPVLGLSAFATLLAEYKTAFMLVGLSGNAGGIGYMLFRLRKARMLAKREMYRIV